MWSIIVCTTVCADRRKICDAKPFQFTYIKKDVAGYVSAKPCGHDAPCFVHAFLEVTVEEAINMKVTKVTKVTK